MRQFGKLIIIGTIAGIALALFLKVIQILIGNQAYVLLFNFDYVPVIQDWEPQLLVGYLFHFITCIVSAVALFYLLRIIQREYLISPYVLVYTVGGGILFSLTGLSEQPPAITDGAAWFYWTAAHAVFGLIVGGLIKNWK
ncbi:hypothetical protein ABZ756_14555 [Mammaliicoccus sciuri]|uniref:hypothetical protein n=1 Tax=Sporosarcina TaxID=1569 RepID=UPI001C8DA6C5|nr:hypothetical protein [Sporosarcina aquimarina]MBY0223226.1 hypothetical protein [Sporosarcina aquimarina]